jgi:hypothetical protein
MYHMCDSCNNQNECWTLPRRYRDTCVQKRGGFWFSVLVHDESFAVGFPPLTECILGHDVGNFDKGEI